MLNKKITSLVLVLGTLIGSVQTGLCCANRNYVVNIEDDDDDDYFYEDSAKSYSKKIFFLSLISNFSIDFVTEQFKKKYTVTPKEDEIDKNTSEEEVTVQTPDEVAPQKPNNQAAGSGCVTTDEKNNVTSSNFKDKVVPEVAPQKPSNQAAGSSCVTTDEDDKTELPLSVPQKILKTVTFSPYRTPSFSLAAKILGSYDKYSKFFDGRHVYRKGGSIVVEELSPLQVTLQTILFAYIFLHTYFGVLIIAETIRNAKTLAWWQILMNLVKPVDPLFNSVAGFAKGLYDGTSIPEKVGLSLWYAFSGSWSYGDVISIEPSNDQNNLAVKKVVTQAVKKDDTQLLAHFFNSGAEYDGLIP